MFRLLVVFPYVVLRCLFSCLISAIGMPVIWLLDETYDHDAIIRVLNNSLEFMRR